MRAIICPRCGAPLQNGVEECPYCGVGLEHEHPAQGANQQNAPARPQAPVVPPSGWVSHRNAWYGFSIAHPREWLVVPVSGQISVREDVAGLCAAWLIPIQVPPSPDGQPVPAQQVASYYASRVSALNPGAQAWFGQEQSPDPCRAIIRTRRPYLNQVIEGIFTVFVQGNSAMISGYECPPQLMSEKAPILKQILSTYRIDRRIPRQVIAEPQERAFQAAAPQGWLYQAAVNRNNIGGKGTLIFSATRDATNTMGVSIPGILWTFVSGGMMGGMWGGFGGHQSLPFMPAGDFCHRWVAQWMGQYMQNLTITNIQPRPDVVYRVYQELLAGGTNPATMDVDAVFMTTRSTEAGQQIRQVARIDVYRSKQAGGWMSAGPWIGQLSAYYRAPESEFEEWQPILEGILNSMDVSPAWKQGEDALVRNYVARAQQDIQRRTQQISQTLSETSDIITSSYWLRQDTYDRLSHAWSNATLGYQDMTDGAGTTYNIPTGFDRYWVDGLGTVYGGDWNTRPDIQWTPLEPTGI